MPDSKDVIIDDEKLISEVQYNGRAIWNSNLEEHKDQPTLTANWTTIITNLELEPTDNKIRIKVRGRWGALKKNFAREYRKEPKLTTGSEPKEFHSTFKHYQRLYFLRETLDPAESEGNFSACVEAATKKEKEEAAQKKEEEAKKDLDSDFDNSSVEEVEESFDSEEVIVFEMVDKTKSKEANGDPESKDVAKKKAPAIPTPRTLTLEFAWNDENMLFFCSMHKTFTSIPPGLAFKLRAKMMRDVEEFLRLAREEGALSSSDEDEEEPSKKIKRKHRKEKRSFSPRNTKEVKDARGSPPPPPPQMTVTQPQTLQFVPLSQNWSYACPQPNPAAFQDATQEAWSAQVPSVNQEVYCNSYPPQTPFAQSAAATGYCYDYLCAPSCSTSEAPQFANPASHPDRPPSTAQWSSYNPAFPPQSGSEAQPSRPQSTVNQSSYNPAFVPPPGSQAQPSRPPSTVNRSSYNPAFVPPPGSQGQPSRPPSTAQWSSYDPPFPPPPGQQAQPTRPPSTVNRSSYNSAFMPPPGPQAQPSRPQSVANWPSSNPVFVPPSGSKAQSTGSKAAVLMTNNQGLQSPAHAGVPPQKHQMQPPPRTASVLPCWKPTQFQRKPGILVPQNGQTGAAARLSVSSMKSVLQWTPASYQNVAPSNTGAENIQDFAARSAVHRAPRL